MLEAVFRFATRSLALAAWMGGTPHLVLGQSPPGILTAPAIALEGASASISMIWPGFWQSTQSYVLTRRRTDALLLSTDTPTAGFAPVSGVAGLESGGRRPYYHVGPVRDFMADAGLLITGSPASQRTIMAAVSSRYQTVAGLVHETFHGFQSRTFAAPAMSPSFVPLDSLGDTAVFIRSLNDERGLISSALRTDDTVRLRADVARS